MRDSREGWVYSDRIYARFSYTDYLFLHKLFELCPFLQTILPHENHFEDFIPTPQNQ